MDIRQDFILDENGDFPLEDKIVGGEYVKTNYGNSDFQHRLSIILNPKGSFKQDPLVGFNAATKINKEYSLDTEFLEIKDTLVRDRYYPLTGVIFPSKNKLSIDLSKIQNRY